MVENSKTDDLKILGIPDLINLLAHEKTKKIMSKSSCPGSLNDYVFTQQRVSLKLVEKFNRKLKLGPANYEIIKNDLISEINSLK